MLQRCENPRNKKYPIYGGRGIRVSERYHSFESFLADVGLKPFPKRLYSLDRVDVNKGYELGNLRWATAKTQRLNQRAMIARNLEMKAAA
jgi:hypothetical protein